MNSGKTQMNLLIWKASDLERDIDYTQGLLGHKRYTSKQGVTKGLLMVIYELPKKDTGYDWDTVKKLEAQEREKGKNTPLTWKRVYNLLELIEKLDKLKPELQKIKQECAVTFCMLTNTRLAEASPLKELPRELVDKLAILAFS
jgi:hypothetical protein